MVAPGGAEMVASAPGALLLEDRLCLALYTASRAMTARYRPALSALGLTYPQYLVMVLLWDDGPTTVGRIGARLNLDSSTLSPLVQRLETLNLVVRERGRRDQREVVVHLTARGDALRAEAAAVPGDICAATGLTSAQQASLVTELRALAARLDDATGSTVPA